MKLGIYLGIPLTDERPKMKHFEHLKAAPEAFRMESPDAFSGGSCLPHELFFATISLLNRGLIGA